MRIDTKKFLFMGMHDEKDAFFTKAQELGIIQFIDMHASIVHEVSKESETIAHAIKVLRGLPPVEQEETEEYALADGLAYKITQLKGQLEKLLEQKRILKLEIARVAPFGNFSTEEIKQIEEEGNRCLQFYCARPHLETVPDTAIYITTEQGLDYYFAVNDRPTHFEEMIEMQIDQPLGELRNQLEIVREDVHKVEERIKSYSKYHTFLHKAYIHKLDTDNLNSSRKFAENKIEGEVFAVEGWVPVTHLDEMHRLVEEMHVISDEIAIEESDVAPTCLENKGYHRIGEDLVHIYDTPANVDKDPSMWVLVWFSLFFAMIIGDGGYGLLFLGTAFYLRYKFGELKAAGKRVWKLFVILSVSCIAWGVLTNSFFGLEFSPNNPVREFSVLNWLSEKKVHYHIVNETPAYHEMIKKYPQLQEQTDASTFLKEGVRERDGQVIHELADNTANGIMMELALLIGIVHVSLGMARYIRFNYAGIGWIIAIIGGLLYVPVYLKVPSMVNYVLGLPVDIAARDGPILMGVGFSLAIGLSIYQHKILGIFETATVVQIFADILSYLRLYALGLAGGIVSATVNGFAAQAGPVLAVIPLVLGHTINILLSIMGGIIHGLRLNFLEWYHYCFEGGGKRYNPLRKLAKEL